MALPDVVVNIKSAGGSRTLPSGTGVAFFTGVTQRGSTAKARALRSLQDFIDYFGGRLTTSVLYDAVETYFAEDGRDLFVSRVFGSGAAQATRNLLDASSGVSLVVKAGQLGDPDPGTWGNSLTVEVVAVTGGFQINVYNAGALVESSSTLVTQADAIGWALANSKYVVITLGASSLVPAPVAPAALSGGTDGAAVADADWQLGLNLLVKDYGAGQVAAPGRTTAAGQLQLLAHAVANNRFALLDLPDSSVAATMVSAAQALYTAPNNGRRYGQPAWPWEIIPGLTALSTRTVPPSARLAAQYARVDSLGNPNQAAAGRNGIAQFVTDLSQPAAIDSDRKAMNEAGITVSRRRYRVGIVTSGMRTLADQTNDAQWSMAPNVRCVMAFVDAAIQVGNAHEFDQVDGQGLALSDYKSDLIDAAAPLYSVGALYGDTPQQAYYVDVSSALNPATDLAAGKMHARVALRTSPSAEVVIIDVVKTPITQSL